ncbi:hypothetical protein [Vibrio jasicida]|uniref:hypothetical protein n=1 Tax=Vibrio jasicida TaxID=766224 RepID=UPI000CE38DFE|nr:hypothetical protein [Vibrio jasicida]
MCKSITHLALADSVAALQDFKKSPASYVTGEHAKHNTLILSRNTPLMYCIPAPLYEHIVSEITKRGLNIGELYQDYLDNSKK